MAHAHDTRARLNQPSQQRCEWEEKAKVIRDADRFAVSKA